MSSSQLVKLTELSQESDLTWLSWIDLSQLNSTLKLNLSWVEQLELDDRSNYHKIRRQKNWFNCVSDQSWIFYHHSEQISDLALWLNSTLLDELSTNVKRYNMLLSWYAWFVMLMNNSDWWVFICWCSWLMFESHDWSSYWYKAAEH